MNGLILSYRIHPKGSKCNWCLLVIQLDTYLKSKEFERLCKKAFSVAELQSIQKCISSQLVFSLLGRIVKDYKHSMEKNWEKQCVFIFEERELSVLRYIGGACMYHIAKDLKQSVERKIIGKFHEAKVLEHLHRFINFMIEPEGYITTHTSDPSSLMEVIRRQGNQKCLTFISDYLFHFFKILFSKVKCVQTFEHIKRRPQTILQESVESLEKNEIIITLFCNLFASYSNACECPKNEEVDEQMQFTWSDHIVNFELEKALVLHKVILYICKVHLSDMTSEYLDTVIGKKKSYQLHHSLESV